MKPFVRPTVRSARFPVQSAQMQVYPITPDCGGSACGEDVGFYCANGEISPFGSDYIIVFQLANTNCSETPDPVAYGCEFIANNGDQNFTLQDCELSDLSPTVLGVTCSEAGCEGNAAVYEVFCPEPDNEAPECDDAVSVRVRCPDVPASSCNRETPLPDPA